MIKNSTFTASFSDNIKVLMGLFAIILNFFLISIIFSNIYSGTFSNSAQSVWISLILILLVLLINSITILMFLNSKSYKELIFPHNIEIPYKIIHFIGCIFGLFISGIAILLIVSDLTNTGSYEPFLVAVAFFGAGILISSLVGLIPNKRTISSFIFLISVLIIPLYFGWAANNAIMSIFWYALAFALVMFISLTAYIRLRKNINNSGIDSGAH